MQLFAILHPSLKAQDSATFAQAAMTATMKLWMFELVSGMDVVCELQLTSLLPTIM